MGVTYEETEGPGVHLGGDGEEGVSQEKTEGVA